MHGRDSVSTGLKILALGIDIDPESITVRVGIHRRRLVSGKDRYDLIISEPFCLIIYGGDSVAVFRDS